MKLDVVFSELDRLLDVSFNETQSKLELDFGEIQQVAADGKYTLFQGEYAVTPTVDGTSVPTKDKLMEDDLTVNPIPYFDVSNTSGGTTIYIGKEIEVNGN